MEHLTVLSRASSLGPFFKSSTSRDVEGLTQKTPMMGILWMGSFQQDRLEHVGNCKLYGCQLEVCDDIFQIFQKKLLSQDKINHNSLVFRTLFPNNNHRKPLVYFKLVSQFPLGISVAPLEWQFPPPPPAPSVRLPPATPQPQAAPRPPAPAPGIACVRRLSIPGSWYPLGNKDSYGKWTIFR